MRHILLKCCSITLSAKTPLTFEVFTMGKLLGGDEDFCTVVYPHIMPSKMKQ